ncbi:hypothetical protein LIPSTDRAFT_73463 [Lipomyces starkeyi NRRL Y-11557]|uniref:Uncharacterized protein n=1 Tax=Lipomyces starkeyi NRRL Y-11557 TaxID=675824 RepID=A0A1E3Q2A0_LIPST|nr:hypothetical protein LIPSTDRAFT_73463 [Lipomyces starkeyi NRRL Y-11557]
MCKGLSCRRELIADLNQPLFSSFRAVAASILEELLPVPTATPKASLPFSVLFVHLSQILLKNFEERNFLLLQLYKIPVYSSVSLVKKGKQSLLTFDILPTSHSLVTPESTKIRAKPTSEGYNGLDNLASTVITGKFGFVSLSTGILLFRD